MLSNLFEENSTKKLYIDKEKVINEIYIEIVFENVELIINNDQKKIINYIKKRLVEKYNILSDDIISQYSSKIINKMFGYDILQKYIEDKFVTDIRVVGYESIYIKKKGKWKKTTASFKSKEDLNEFIICTVIKNGGKINYENPITVVTDKKYNLRIEAGIAPVNAINDSIVIRIHRNTRKITMQNLQEKYKMFDDYIYKKIKKYIKDGKNIIISGKGGSGKTTLLRAIISELDENVSISTNEESLELYIDNKNIIQREVVENKTKNNYSLELLAKYSLINSSDVIIVGEIKGGESIYYLDAIATGHIGYATIHSNTAYNTLSRLSMLAKRSKSTEAMSIEFIKLIFASSVDVIIQLENFKVKEILEIEYNHSNDTFKYNEVMKNANN